MVWMTKRSFRNKLLTLKTNGSHLLNEKRSGPFYLVNVKWKLFENVSWSFGRNKSIGLSFSLHYYPQTFIDLIACTTSITTLNYEKSNSIQVVFFSFEIVIFLPPSKFVKFLWEKLTLKKIDLPNTTWWLQTLSGKKPFCAERC